MTKFFTVLYLCSVLSGQCPSYQYTGHSFDTFSECTDFGYRLAYGTYRQLEINEEYTDEYIENSRIVVKFECKPIEIEKEITPPPKPKGKST
jgi:hypothetical protein|tara:strand:+ start:2968 stop:3243 length:276 start_codon:yes stop_codon:yes gene_type:complete